MQDKVTIHAAEPGEDRGSTEKELTEKQTLRVKW